MSIRIEDLVFDGGGSNVSIDDLVFDEAQQTDLQEQAKLSQLRQVPEAINLSGGLPVEAPKTKTFMEDEEGKPVEVRRAQAIDIRGKIIQEPISPDGMTLDFRGNLIKQKYKELSEATKLPLYEYRDKALPLRSEISKLQETQQAHEANQLDYLSRLITRKPMVSVDVETGLGEGGGKGEITTVPIQTRTGAAIKMIGDQREFIDNIIVNDKFLDYIKTKGIDAPGMMSRMAGQYLNIGEAPDKVEQLKKNPEVRKLAEEWAMTTPDFMDTATDIFKRAWDGYAGAIGSGTVGPIGLLLKEAGFEQSGQALVDAAEYADQQRRKGQDPRKVGELAQFGRDVSGGLGFTTAAITAGVLGNAARAGLGLNSAKTISLFQKANTLTFSGLNSAWAGYSEAKSDGATEEQANQAALFSALTQAPLELVSPLQKWISRFDGAQQTRIYKGLNRAAQAVAEGAQEALFNEMPQQIAGNLVKKYVYDPNQDIFDGTLYAGSVGGASGVIASIFTQMLGAKKAKAKALQGDEEGSQEIDIESKADEIADQLAPDEVSDLAQQMTTVSGEIDNLKQEIADDEMGLQAFEKGSQQYQSAELALNEKKANLTQLQTQFDKLSAGPTEVKEEAPEEKQAGPSATKEEAQARIEELNKEFDALDENDQAGIDRVNQQIFAEQNKIAELTAIEQGIEPQGTTPTRQPQLPESGRRSPFGTFYPERPVLQAFMSSTDKVIGKIQATGKRAQKLKNSIRTAVSNNAGFLAGTDTQVISSEEYNKLTGNKLSADSGTYKAVFFGDKKYLVIPDVNVLQQVATRVEQRAASKDAAIDQESRAAAKKLEEEMIHLSMFQGIQDEYKALKKPKLTEQEYIVKRIVDVAKEVKRTNPNALPGVSEVYLNQKNKNLDDLTFSQEFMRMVAQRVRTGQITEDLNAIRAAEKEAFSDKGAIASLKNSLLNAIQFLRTSIARYLGKGTSTKEVEKMLNTMNTILDEYGIVKGEANYEFKDYSAAQPKGEVVSRVEPKEIKVFKGSQTEGTKITKGSYVSPNREFAKNYGANVVEATIDTSNYLNGPEQIKAALEKVAPEIANNQDVIDNNYDWPIVTDIANNIDDIQNKLVDAGYGGIIQSFGTKDTDGQIIVFDESTVKESLPVEPEVSETITPAIEAKAGVTPQMDADYLAAVESGDMETAQRMVDEAAKKAGYNSPKVYHGSSDKPFNIFKTKRGKKGTREGGAFFTPTETLANYFAEIAQQVKYGGITDKPGIIYKAYLKMDKPVVIDQKFENVGSIEDKNINRIKAAKKYGFDGIIWKNTIEPFHPDGVDQYIVFSPEQIKSADPVTYDEQGNVIPLSERFDVTSPIIARAGVTPEGEPMSKKSESAMKRISNGIVSDLNRLVESLKPKDNKALTEYKSRTTEKGKTYPRPLISPYSVAANLFTSNAFTAGTNALNKIFEGNPDADFFRVAQDIGSMDEAAIQRAYSINSEEQLVLSQLMYKMMPTFIGQVMDSSMPLSAREAFALDARNVEANLARKVTLSLRESGRKTQYANTLRNIGGAGMAIQSYKSSIIDSMGQIYALTKAPFEDIANAIRGDRRKSVDKVANIQSVFRKAVSLIKQSQLNPEKVRQSIRAEVGKKKNARTREILLDFSAGLFDTKEDKYANMIVDQTVQNILAIGMNRKGFSIDNVSNFMYQSFAAAAKQMGVQMAGVPKQQKGKRSGKYLEMVKAVIGNDNAYKAFLADLSNRMAEKYQSKEAFNKDFGDLFKSLRSNEWSDSLRTQAIKDATDAINYKFADLFQYLGEKRNAAQAGVREHIRAELRGTGASNELIDKFIADADAYLNQETNRILTEKLGFTVNEETGKVTPKPLISRKIKEEAEAQFKDIKNLKDITKLSLTDEGNFKEGLISRIITEIGMSKENATELADLISSEMDKALIAQRSENLTTALKKAEGVLTNNKIKRKTNQRTLLQRLIQMANMGMLDSEMVYEAFRQTHDFQKNYLPYDAEFVNTIRQWGDRISLLPEGVIRSIEEEKMGRSLLEKSKFTGNEILSSYWYWSLLSQIGTPALNIISGVNNLFANIGVWSLYSPKTAIPMMQALYSAVSGKQSPAVNSFLYVMRNGLNPSGMQDERRAKYPKTNVIESSTPQNAPKIVYYLTNFGDGKINFLPDWFNTVLKNISPRAFLRSLRATDAFLREVAFEARMASAGARPYSQQGFDIARRQAEQELVSSQAKGKQKEQEIVIRANEIYREQRAKEARLELAEIEQDALETVYNQDPQGAIGQIANFANGFLAKYRATKYIIPFTNVVANVTNEFINYTPGFSQFRLYQARKNGVNDPFTQGRSDKQLELGIKGMLGFAALVVPLIIQALQSGDEEEQENRPAIQLYAEGPRDPKQQRIWAQNGGIKYSIRIGDKYFSLLGTPLVVPLAMSAMYAEEIQGIKKRQEKLSEIDYSDMAAKVLSSPFSIAFVAVLNQSFLTGVSDILGLTQAKDPVKEGEGIISGILSRMIVPGALRDITKLTTNERAVGSTWASNLLKEMPGAIKFLNKDVNYFGDPARYPSIVAEEGFGQRLASLFGRLASQETVDPAFKIMYDMNLTPPSWDSSLNWSNGKRMTKEQELEFIRSAGPAMRDWIVENEDALRDPELDQEGRQNVLSNGISGIRRQYKADLESQYQDEIGIDFENM